MRKTAGELAVQALKDHNPDQTVEDTSRAMHKGYLDEIRKVTERSPAKTWTDPYYIVVITKKEKILYNVIRRYFFARKSMPTPTWDQTVFRYEPKKGDLFYLWTIPDPETAAWLASFPQDAPEGYEKLIEFVRDFASDRLYQRFHRKWHNEEYITDMEHSNPQRTCDTHAEQFRPEPHQQPTLSTFHGLGPSL